jgi:hypothetical protein
VLGRLLAKKQVDPGQTICVIVSETGLKTEAEVPTRQGIAFDYDSLRALVQGRLTPHHSNAPHLFSSPQRGEAG